MAHPENRIAPDNAVAINYLLCIVALLGKKITYILSIKLLGIKTNSIDVNQNRRMLLVRLKNVQVIF